MRNLRICTLVFLFSCSSGEDVLTEETSYYYQVEVGNIEGSLVSAAHTSEGFLIKDPISDEIIHFYRKDSSSTSNHIGNGGHLVTRSSPDQGTTWSKESVVYADEFDDRNIHGGIIDEFYVAIFMRRINVPDPERFSYLDVDHRALIYDLRINQLVDTIVFDAPAMRGTTGSNHLFYVKDKGYFNSFFEHYKVSYRFLQSIEDLNSGWTTAYDYQQSNEFYVTESSFTSVNDTIIIGLTRDQSQIDTANHYQLISLDQADTWLAPQRTNIALPYFCPAPLIFQDEKSELLISIATDRRENGSESQLWVYSNTIDSCLASAKSWEFVKSFSIPHPSDYYFYGYPTAVSLDEDSYLVIFTDSNKDSSTGRENADFFQFTISIFK